MIAEADAVLQGGWRQHDNAVLDKHDMLSECVPAAGSSICSPHGAEQSRFAQASPCESSQAWTACKPECNQLPSRADRSASSALVQLLQCICFHFIINWSWCTIMAALTFLDKSMSAHVRLPIIFVKSSLKGLRWHFNKPVHGELLMTGAIKLLQAAVATNITSFLKSSPRCCLQALALPRPEDFTVHLLIRLQSSTVLLAICQNKPCALVCIQGPICKPVCPGSS